MPPFGPVTWTSSKVPEATRSLSLRSMSTLAGAGTDAAGDLGLRTRWAACEVVALRGVRALVTARDRAGAGAHQGKRSSASGQGEARGKGPGGHGVLRSQQAGGTDALQRNNGPVTTRLPHAWD